MITINITMHSGYAWQESVEDAEIAARSILAEHGDEVNCIYTVPIDGTDARMLYSAASVAAAALGRKGGSARSERKVAASRANGRLGGRPPGVLTTRSRIEARWTSDPADLENRDPIPGSPEAMGSPKQVFAAVREYRRKIGSAFCRVEYRHLGRILTYEEIADLETAVMLAEEQR